MAKNDYIIKLPTLREPTSKTPENARKIIKTWTQAFEKVLTNNVKDGLSTVFREDAWIRDFLGLSWDFRTINGLDEIATFFKENQPRAGIRQIVPREKGAFQPSFGDPAPGIHWVESMFDFQSSVGRGKELRGFEEAVGVSRPTGHVDPKGGNWKERRERQVEFVNEDPTVLVIGAGELHILDAGS
ncbi:flavin-containing monooxygenase [Colletotrichum filicis]|nr:flavin-containing monooxygenase [Colletotrichum filicis]